MSQSQSQWRSPQRERAEFASRSPSEANNLHPRLYSTNRRPPVNGESL